MKFKYRVKGLIRKPFILRSAYFGIGDNMDFYITESELKFVSERCEVAELIDLEQKPVETPEPVLEETENKPKGVENELQSKRTSKSKNKN